MTPAPKAFLPDGIWACERCSPLFRVHHGNQRLCGSVERKAGGFASRRGALVRGAPLRWLRVVVCGGGGASAVSRAAVSAAGSRTRRQDVCESVPSGARKRWAVDVMGGGVRCRRSASRRFAELVDGDVVGGLIAPTARWHLGHFDGEGAAMTSPEHVACNTGAPSRLRARR